jgi:orotidine-5'-phosphate decarboxylase
MPPAHYITRLHDAVRRKRNPVVVGLDPRWEQLPEDIVRAARKPGRDHAATVAAAYEAFCLRIIDVVAPLIPAVKPQAAFFEEWGPAGCAALARVMRRARQAGLIVICDAKRGDIGSTAEAYARGYLAGADPDAAAWAADALTINPYLGRDTVEPFVRVAVERGAGLYILVRTSNPGAGTFQDVVSNVDGQPLYHRVAGVVEELANASRGDEVFGAVGSVVGATYPRELVELRKAMPHATFLIPGYGTQGATAADIASAFTPNGLGAVVNSSRGIIFAHERKPYAEQFGQRRWEDAVAAATRDMIADVAQHTSAGRLAAP